MKIVSRGLEYAFDVKQHLYTNVKRNGHLVIDVFLTTKNSVVLYKQSYGYTYVDIINIQHVNNMVSGNLKTTWFEKLWGKNTDPYQYITDVVSKWVSDDDTSCMPPIINAVCEACGINSPKYIEV